jgi:hypothetical protein
MCLSAQQPDGSRRRKHIRFPIHVFESSSGVSMLVAQVISHPAQMITVPVVLKQPEAELGTPGARERAVYGPT